MAQLWGGRFTKETDKLVYNFNASISFDQKVLQTGYPGKHRACMHAWKAGNPDKRRDEDIVRTLDEICKDVESGKLKITDEYEDIHSFVEANLIDRLGDTGKNFTPDEAEMIRLHWICVCIHVWKCFTQMNLYEICYRNC